MPPPAYSAAIVLASRRRIATIVLASVPAGGYLTCLAHELARAAAGTRLRACAPAPWSPTLGRRLLAVLRDPSPARIRATFTPAFLRTVPVAALRKTAAELRASAGACRDARAERALDEGALLRLDCATHYLRALVTADAADPQRIAGLRVVLAPAARIGSPGSAIRL